VAVEVVVFDIGETLVDETMMWTRAAASATWGILGVEQPEGTWIDEDWKPDPRFFSRIADLLDVAPAKITYVGDRVDNDVGPALEAGMLGVHIKRGPWGYLQEPPAAAIRIDSLDELPAVLA
jgi:FMN phosphatase YigB (HAD superfamily)